MERALEKLKQIEKELKSKYFERDHVIEGAFCALLTQNHLLLIGPPGTAKSQIVSEICTRIQGARVLSVAPYQVHHPRGAIRRRELKRA